jgi:hypothetical protein
MTKYTTVLGDLLRHFSRSEFESAVSDHKGISEQGPSAAGIY